MDKHTPGPWVVGNGSRATGFTVKIATDELLVGGHGLKSEANARLIAAAPDLLGALEAMTVLAEGPAGGVTVQMKRDAIATARTAIAKARGEA